MVDKIAKHFDVEQQGQRTDEVPGPSHNPRSLDPRQVQAGELLLVVRHVRAVETDAPARLRRPEIPFQHRHDVRSEHRVVLNHKDRPFPVVKARQCAHVARRLNPVLEVAKSTLRRHCDPVFNFCEGIRTLDVTWAFASRSRLAEQVGVFRCAYS